MVRKLTPPMVRIALGMALPLVGAWAIADDHSDIAVPAPAVELNEDEGTSSDSATVDNDSSYEEPSVATNGDEEPGQLPDSAQEPTLAPVAENADSENQSAVDSEKSTDSDSPRTEIIRERPIPARPSRSSATWRRTARGITTTTAFTRTLTKRDA